MLRFNTKRPHPFLKATSILIMGVSLVACGGSGSAGGNVEAFSIDGDKTRVTDNQGAITAARPLYDHQLVCETQLNALSVLSDRTESSETAYISWTAPTQRENGDNIYLYELSGYQLEISHAGNTASKLSRFIAEDGTGKVGCNLPITPGADYTVSIASLDTNGLQSDFYSVSFGQ